MGADAKSTRRNQPRLIAVEAANFPQLPGCGIKDAEHAGRQEKRCWLEANWPLGLRAKALLAPDGQPAGYIEYLPGEFAWRGVDARGYLFVHCIWLHSRKYQRRGWASLMLDACVTDARTEGNVGVAAIVREGPWLADRRLFAANGFETVDRAAPDYELVARKFDSAASPPRFPTDWPARLARYNRGLTIIRSRQCPYIAKFASEIAETAEAEYGIKATIVELESWRDAQQGPTPYAVFSVIYNGRLLADHPISRTRFRNILARQVR